MSFPDFFSNQISKVLQETLEAVGAKAMVVGHTPQLSGVNWYIYGTLSPKSQDPYNSIMINWVLSC